MKRLKQWLRVRLSYWLASISLWPSPKKKFVIFGQGRTGSTLLVSLLNSSDDIHCDREIFNIPHFTGEIITRPIQYVKGRSKRFFNKVYGFKVKIYQLRDDHHLSSVRGFLDELIREGYYIIYLTRENVLQHSYSNVKRSLTGVTHVRDEGHSAKKFSLPVKDLLKEVSFRQNCRQEEEKILQGIKYLHVSYERDLLSQQTQLQTVNTIRDYLGLQPAANVSSTYHKITDKSLADEITNYDEVVLALRESKLDYLIW